MTIHTYSHIVINIVRNVLSLVNMSYDNGWPTDSHWPTDLLSLVNGRSTVAQTCSHAALHERSHMSKEPQAAEVCSPTNGFWYAWPSPICLVLPSIIVKICWWCLIPGYWLVLIVIVVDFSLVAYPKSLSTIVIHLNQYSPSLMTLFNHYHPYDSLPLSSLTTMIHSLSTIFHHT